MYSDYEAEVCSNSGGTEISCLLNFRVLLAGTHCILLTSVSVEVWDRVVFVTYVESSQLVLLANTYLFRNFEVITFEPRRMLIVLSPPPAALSETTENITYLLFLSWNR